jgi:protein-disulfide isomerase-like protein with CxxC motif
MLVGLTANNCQKCGMLKAAIRDMQAAKHILWHNAQEHMDLCRKLGIKSVPALLVYENASDELPVQVITDMQEAIDFVSNYAFPNE